MLEKGYQVPKFDRLPLFQTLLFRPGNEFVEQCGVGSLSVIGMPALMAEVLKKIFDQSLHA